jgi:hypothetical protein
LLLAVADHAVTAIAMTVNTRTKIIGNYKREIDPLGSELN